ncbi:hypothetical protein V6N11_069855 [Hibiscus sabdariffa]|uniref:Uncharacterized protein n=1 Tax=Hibiscus sabdariffa TaxID=183260 RepID=A0ABR2Q414_9ROSI
MSFESRKNTSTRHFVVKQINNPLILPFTHPTANFNQPDEFLSMNQIGLGAFTIHSPASSFSVFPCVYFFHYIFSSKFSTLNFETEWEVLMGPAMVLTPMMHWRGSPTGHQRSFESPLPGLAVSSLHT